MPSTNKNKKFNFKLQNIRKIFTLNIGTILFGALFIYMVVSAVLYLTSSHFTSYQVISGPLSRNETFTALAVHTETVVSADASGYINYYAREGTKINATGVVYGISPQPLASANAELSNDDLSRIRKQMSSFSYGFNPSNFNSTYSFKYELEGNILQYSGANENLTTATEEDSDSGEDSGEDTITVAEPATTLGNQTLSRTPEDGIILYSKDGYAGKTVDTLTAQDFDQNSYHKEDLKTKEAINVGDDVYTIITDERWSLLIALSNKQVTKLNDKTSIRVKFLKDDISQTGDFSIVEIDGEQYGKIDLNSGLIRYATDRFLDIELVTNTQSGLKIPISSIITKEFYVIPTDYQTKGGNGNEAGFLREVNNKGETSTEFVSATLYAEEDNMYYVDKSVFQEGDVLLKPESNDRFVVSETNNLEGVYCVNKGYAVFRKIIIIDQNEEYCIVEKGTSYGLAQYDHIVLNGEDVNEEDILY